MFTVTKNYVPKDKVIHESHYCAQHVYYNSEVENSNQVQFYLFIFSLVIHIILLIFYIILFLGGGVSSVVY